MFSLRLSLRLSLRSLALAVLLCLVALPAAAQYFGRNKVQYDDFDFQVFETEHFAFYYYPEAEQAVRDAARMAERWYERHAQTYGHAFEKRKPVILYANDADFHQTNVLSGMLGEGTGGVTESLKQRVVMPLTGIYGETDHVLGHELVHSFQYDIALSRGLDAPPFHLGSLPLWLVEGTAEYLSVGREDTHTAMWLRDAALRDDLPTIDQLTRDLTYFPYRFGQAYMAYVGGKYGDAAVANIYQRAGLSGVDSAFVYTLGIATDSLSAEWIRAVKDTYLPLMEGRTAPDSLGRPVLSQDLDAGKINLSPALSPDGRYVAFLSERDVFSVNLFIADAETGEVVKKLRSTTADRHFDALRFINSAGAWSPDGKQFAFISFVDGDNEIAVWDLGTGDVERRIRVDDVSALLHLAWSPDGRRLAFSGLDGGISDLYVLDLASGDVRQLTNDRYADLQPAFSPDGRTLAFTTDRGAPGMEGTDFQALDYAPMRLALVDVESGAIERVVRPFEGALHHNPQFSPDGRSLFFVSDQDGFKDVYRLALEEERVYRVTRLKTGVSGITALSPAMTVAARSGDLMASVYGDGAYTVVALAPDEQRGEPLADTTTTARLAGLLPPWSAEGAGLVAGYLADPGAGLPPDEDYESEDYRARLQLDYVAPPTVGVSLGGFSGAGLAGGVGLYFSDMLGNHNLGVGLQMNGTFKDIGGAVTYLNQASRFNYGVTAAHIPYRYGGYYTEADGRSYRINELRRRIYLDQAAVVGSYAFSTTRRVEANAGVVRYGFDYELIAYESNGDREVTSLEAPDPLHLFQAGVALVGDHSVFGFTSPVSGGRYRFEVSPYLGSARFVRLLADYRRYAFLNPVTLAVRGLHRGNYGAGTDDVFGQEYLGHSYYSGFVRGYSLQSFEAGECAETACPAADRLSGTRMALVSAELRVPLLGAETYGLIPFPYLPTELSLFTDAGLAWTADEAPVLSWDAAGRTPVVSVGASARFNLLGALVMEVYYAYPFQRPEKGGHFGLQLVPGW